MTNRAMITRWLLVLIAPLLLSSCLLVPTRFAATLDIKADRSFTFAYVGEVQLLKSSPSDMTDGLLDEDSAAEDDATDGTTDDAQMFKIASQPQSKSGTADDADADDEAQLRRLAEALSKEYGYRSARYIGDRKLAIDYRISGRLDHGFVFPFNPDGEVVLPFLAIELRGKDRVRVKAPGFANDGDAAALPMGTASGRESPGGLLDGTFTLTTSAEIVSQNQEEGAETMTDGQRRIVWKVTPATRDAPMAVLRVAPLP
ncbi:MULTISPECIES: hypothetical protein [unclassified Sphingobium]|uniref:hypothetical protein n=1 Tax=unclassified Sphingobium TaxID=2611147 RepID=UPI0029CAB061|nr:MULTISPECIES: hypothetical protein [unclassified Sphingobium]MCW2393962.1 hypothetical protein [Sphingobium sp. B8D3B]MCW2417476.1 hypothetical protein [Sphingobium sp. B8D3C]